MHENLDKEKRKYFDQKFKDQLFELKNIFDYKKHMEVVLFFFKFITI